MTGTVSTSTDSGSGSNEGGDPPECLSFTIGGEWGHFRRIEGNIVKQTYRIIPRTTVAGLVAAILGLGRNEYYDLFQPENSAIAIEPVRTLRTINMPMNTLSTAGEDIKTVPSRGRKLKIGLPDPTKPRQQHNYEVLVEPAYRIDLWLKDESQYSALQKSLKEGRSYYTPSLGLSEHLAWIEYHGEFPVESGPRDGRVAVDSAVPEQTEAVVPETDVAYGVERSPAFMERHKGGRRTTGFTSYAFNPEAGPLTIESPVTQVVDGRTVMFV